MNKLALAMIVKDEEKTLGRLLDSVKGCFEEIVIVDTGSKDRTKEIAASYGAKIFDFEWVDDFAAARNFSFSKATCPFVMWLDADDVLKPEDRQKLLALKADLGSADAYLMAYDYAQDEFGASTCTLQRHRIVRKDPRVRWYLPIHECLQFPPGNRDAMTDVVVTHKRHSDSLIQDKGRNIRILRKAVAQYPEDQRVKYYFAKELNTEGEHAESARVFEKYLLKGDCHENMVQAYYWLAMDYLFLKDEENAIETAMRGIRFDPRWAEYYALIGQICNDRGDWERSIRWFELAASRPIPQSWGTVLVDKYTWLPRLQLCVAYARSGNPKKAYEWNEAGLAYRPGDSRFQFNREYLRDLLFDRLSPRPVRLNLGSGGKPASGWRNCDLYEGPGVDFRMDQSGLPYRDATVHAIRSEHALEHSDSHYAAEATIKEWARALRSGGYLHLMVPDLDECARKFVESEDRPRRNGERWTQKEWYKYTLYGIQASQGSEPPEGQYHRTGFTKPQIKRLLEDNGFEIARLGNYDGMGTPSIDVEAVLAKKAPRVAWMLRNADSHNPSIRIRRMNVSRWLSRNGVPSKLVEKYDKQDPDSVFASIRDYDAVVFSFFAEFERRIMEKLLLAGVSVIADYNEDLAAAHPEVAHCLRAASVIVCCSRRLAEKAGVYGRTMVIPDAYEVPPSEVQMRKVYAFDVDETLEISGGPVTLADMMALKQEGHIVGICGNWKVFVDTAGPIRNLMAFMNTTPGQPKEDFLRALRAQFKAQEYVMVGNIPGVSGVSDDVGAARKSGWKFIRESDFAAGAR